MNNDLKKTKAQLIQELEDLRGQVEDFRTGGNKKAFLDERLRKSINKYRTVFNISPEAIVLLDVKGHILEINNRVYDWLGYRPEEIIGMHLLTLPFLNKKSKAIIIKNFTMRMIGKEIDPYDVVFTDKNGEKKIGRIRANSIKDEHGKITGDLVMVSDVTELKRAEDVIRESRDKLEERVKERTKELHKVNEELCREIAERKEIERIYERLTAAVEQVHEAIIITDTGGTIIYANPGFERVTGYSRDEVIGKNPRILKSGKHDDAFYQRLWHTISQGKVWSENFINKRKDGTLYHEEATISPIMDKSGTIINYVAVKRDVTTQIALEAQLRQAQKLESIGQLAAGIAHEINTPMQYVGDNTRFFQESFTDISSLLNTYRRLVETAKAGPISPEMIAGVEHAVADSDIEYLVDEIPRAIDQSLEGIEQVSRIVRAMKEFSHPDTEEKTSININEAIESTIMVARNEWKYVAEMKTDFDPDLPLVPCYPGEFNQAILNIIINAAHTIGEVVGDGSTSRGTITISTRRNDNFAVIRISDTGKGITEEIRDKLFDPFFTTKEVGRGTGQGLVISHNVIVEKHGGTLSFETEIGKGTTFIIQLPLSVIP